MSPKLFLILVDAIVREWLRQLFGIEVARDGFLGVDAEEVRELIRRLVALFYADDGFIATRDPALLDEALAILVDLFERVGLRTNTKKTEVMICTPGKIRTRLSDTSYYRRYAGYGTARAWEARRTECRVCGARMRASSLASHMERRHDVYETTVVEEEYLRPPGHAGEVYRAEASQGGRLACPVAGCIGEAATPWSMRRHFALRHPWDRVYIPAEGMYPKCDNCGMQTNPLAFGRGHLQSQTCTGMGERRRQHERRAVAARAQRREFRIYGDLLNRVEKFKYLGRWLSQDDSDARAVRAQLVKARRVWARLGRVLRSENAPPQICGMFYRGVVQAVLLFGSETWALGPALLARLEGFHIRCAYRMALRHRPRKGPDGVWTYPDSASVLKECGLQTMEVYIRRRRAAIVDWVATRPLHAACREGEPMRGSPRQLWQWWE